MQEEPGLSPNQKNTELRVDDKEQENNKLKLSHRRVVKPAEVEQDSGSRFGEQKAGDAASDKTAESPLDFKAKEAEARVTASKNPVIDSPINIGNTSNQNIGLPPTTNGDPDTRLTSSVLTRKPVYFYRDKPLFGLDIGHSSMKVMQISGSKKSYKVIGYGSTQFEPDLIKDGLVNDPRALSESLDELLAHRLTGSINSRRVALALPATRTFIRSSILPIIAVEDLDNAVRLETERYIPLPAKDLYMDYSIIRQTEKDVQLLIIAVPKKVADSYLAVADSLDLEVVALEPSLMSASRIFAELDHADLPTVLVDIGAISSDVIVFDNGVITAGTVPGGGETLNKLISKRLNISEQESHFLKTRYGIGPGFKQKEMIDALAPQADQLIQEIRRVMRYYEEHYEDRKIGQIVITGGGANLLGLNDYLTEKLRAPVRAFTPWGSINFHNLKLPVNIEKSMYIAAGGLAMIRPEEVFT